MIRTMDVGTGSQTQYNGYGLREICQLGHQKMDGLKLQLLLLIKPVRSVGEEAIEGEIVKLQDELGGKVIHNGLGSIVMESWNFQMLVEKP